MKAVKMMQKISSLLICVEKKTAFRMRKNNKLFINKLIVDCFDYVLQLIQGLQKKRKIYQTIDESQERVQNLIQTTIRKIFWPAQEHKLKRIQKILQIIKFRKKENCLLDMQELENMIIHYHKINNCHSLYQASIPDLHKNKLLINMQIYSHYKGLQNI